MTGAVTLAAAAVAGVGMDAYEASQQSAISGQALSLAQNTQGEQQWYIQQLQQLIMNPSSFTSSPMFQSSLNAASRTMASQGYLGSGNETAGLQAQAMQQLFTQEGILGADAGIQNASSPAQALGAASSSLSALSQSAGGALGMMAWLMGNQSGGGVDPGITPSDWAFIQSGGLNYPSLYTDPSGYTYNLP